MREKEIDFRVLIPGEKVPIAGTDKFITVYPLGVDHIFSFPAEVAEILKAVGTIEGLGTMKPTEAGVLVIKKLTPILLGRASNILLDCCDPKPKNAPHWLLPLLAEAWVRQTFSESAVNPWKAATGAALSKMGITAPGLSEAFSSFLSRWATLAGTSSIDTSKAEQADASLTAAGLIPS